MKKRVRKLSTARVFYAIYCLYMLSTRLNRVRGHLNLPNFRTIVRKKIGIQMFMLDNGQWVNTQDAFELFRAQVLVDIINTSFSQKRIEVILELEQSKVQAIAKWFLLDLIKKEIIDCEHVFEHIMPEWKKLSHLRGGQLQELFWKLEEEAEAKNTAIEMS